MANQKQLRKTTTGEGAARPAASPAKWTRYYGWFLFLFGTALYVNTLFFDYTLDDAIVIYDNEFTTRGVAGIPDLLRHDTFRGFFKVEGKENIVAGGRYRPLTPVMYALEVQLFAPVRRDATGQVVKDSEGRVIFDPNEGGKRNLVKLVGHLVNVLLYAASGVVLFLLLRDLLARHPSFRKETGRAAPVAFAAALLFLAHPIHTEVVANIKGRDEIVSLLGSITALLLTFRSWRDNKPWKALWAGCLFFTALLSKENAITFLAIVPLTLLCFTDARPGTVVRQSVPYVAVAVLFLLIRGGILGWEGTGTPPRELMNNPFLKLVGNQYVDFTAGEKYATILYTLGKYVLLLLFPYPLSHDYYPRAVDIMGFGDWQVVLSALLYLGMGWFAFRNLPRRSIASFCILYFLATLSIVSNLVFPIGTNMSERFLYLPSVGFALLAAHLFYRLGRGHRGALAGGGLLLLVLSAATITRNFAWKDNFTLFLKDVSTVPNSAKLRNAAGGELITQSLKPENEARKKDMQRTATEHLQEAIRIHPGYKNAYLLLGNAYNYLQSYESSIQAYRQALRLDPGYGEASNNLAVTLRDAGRYYGEQKGDLSQALAYLRQAYEMKPKDYETLRLLGVANGISGNGAAAISFFTQALASKPDDPDALYNLGSAYLNAGQSEQGMPFIRRAVEMDPEIENKRKQR
jgi:tetratricopeptide (TPR) repeat protein